MTTRGWAGAAVAALALTLALAACGGEASARGGGSGSGTGTAASAENDRYEAALEFAECMRKHGVDVPDPDEQGRFAITPEQNVDREEFQEAQEECGNLLPPPPELSEEERQEMEDAMVEFARCMREHGIDVPDPKSRGEGGGFALELPGDLDPNDPEFREAQDACQPILEEAERNAFGGGS